MLHLRTVRQLTIQQDVGKITPITRFNILFNSIVLIAHFCLQANEIAFINTLSEQNKKMDIMTKHQDVKARLMDMQEERQRKIGEKAAKEAAVDVKNNVTVLF